MRPARPAALIGKAFAAIVRMIRDIRTTTLNCACVILSNAKDPPGKIEESRSAAGIAILPGGSFASLRMTHGSVCAAQMDNMLTIYGMLAHSR